MSEELKPCPFCGDPMVHAHETVKHVNQGDCPIGAYAWGGARCVETWNRRAPSPDMREAVEALEEYAREATKAITGLVGGGSELFGKQIGDLYTADLEYCVARIRNRFADGHEAKVALAKAETNLRHWREECGKLHAQVRSLTGAKP